MAIELQQNLRLQQHLVMTPQLQMAIKLLQLSRMELVEMIRQELESNPTLEETEEIETPEEASQEPTADTADTVDASESREVTMEESFDERLDWQQYMDEYSSTGRTHFDSEEKESLNYEAFTASRTTLYDHLRWQLLMTRPTAEQESIGSLIIGNLNKYGYLDVPLEEISSAAESTVDEVENVLYVMQTFDPPGICARSLRECLQIQTKQLGIDDPVVAALLRDHLKNLENRRYQVIARELKCDMDTLSAAIHLIRQLDPRPGYRHGEEDQIYITPDVYVHKEGDGYIVLLNDDEVPQLHINSYYRQAVRRGEPIARDTRTYLRDRIRSAEWLIKSIQQRRRTIYNVMVSIVGFQRSFFDLGIAHLKPMVLRDVAEDINMHESTISRVTTNKYAHTPHGIFELKFFLTVPLTAQTAIQSHLPAYRRKCAGSFPENPLKNPTVTKKLQICSKRHRE